MPLDLLLDALLTRENTHSIADCSLEWFRVLDQCMGSFRNHPPSSKIPLERRPPIFSMPMFTHEEDAHFRAIATDYALRICALRETFEEIGILLGNNVARVGTDLVVFCV